MERTWIGESVLPKPRAESATSKWNAAVEFDHCPVEWGEMPTSS